VAIPAAAADTAQADYLRKAGTPAAV